MKIWLKKYKCTVAFAILLLMPATSLYSENLCKEIMISFFQKISRKIRRIPYMIKGNIYYFKQEEIPISEFPKDIRYLIRDMLHRSRTKKTPQGFREFGFLVIHLKNGEKVVTKFTSNKFNKILSSHFYEAFKAGFDQVNPQEVLFVRAFHNHPDKDPVFASHLSSGDIVAAFKLRKIILEMFEINISVEEIAVPNNPENPGMVYRFVLPRKSKKED